MASWGNIRTKIEEHKYITSRNVNKVIMESFEKDLSDMSWNEVYRESDVEQSYCCFVSTFKKIVDKHAPLKQRE